MSNIRPRFSPNRAGAKYPPHQDDLLMAYMMPTSLRVHCIKMCVYPSGLFEFGEWITSGGCGNSIFHRENSIIDHVELERIRILRDDLWELEKQLPSIESLGDDFDPHDYPDNDRRSISWWLDSEIISTGLPTKKFCTDFGVSEETYSLMAKATNDLWSLLLNNLEYPHLERGETYVWSFPVLGQGQQSQACS